MFVVFFLSCGDTTTAEKQSDTIDDVISIVTKDYELILHPKQQALLILFPGFPSNAENIKNEFKIVKPAKENGISLLLMNFNRHLWMEKGETENLAKQINDIFTKHKLNRNNVYIGGMSSGGNVSLLLSNYLVKNKTNFAPKGAFIVDSPIDLYGLYESSVKDTKREDFSAERLAEPKGIINMMESVFGKEDVLLPTIQKYAPFTQKTNNIQNISSLETINLRLYIEPDKEWWKENRQTDYESTNAYSIKSLTEYLQEKNWTKINCIETKNKGYRANGDRHPHSWSIVDVKDLIDWML